MNTAISFSFPVSLFQEDRRIFVRKGKEFLKGLSSVEGLFGMAEEALVKAAHLDLRSFNPLGMDGACQLHAFRTANIVRKILDKSKFLDELEGSLRSIRSKRETAHALYETFRGIDTAEKLAKFRTLVAPFDDKPSLKEVLQKLDLTSVLSAKVHFLIISYLLTLTKDYRQITAENGLICEHCNGPITEDDGIFKEVTNSKKWVQWVKNRLNSEVNVALLDDVIILARRHLIQESHRYLKRKTFTYGGLRHFHFLENNIRVVQSRPELPDYYTLTAVFRSALYKKIPVILAFSEYAHLGHIYTETGAKYDSGLFLLPSQDSSHFEAKPLHRRLKNRGVMVVSVKKNGQDPSTFLKKLMIDFDFMHLCKLDGAQHKQYTDSELHQTPAKEIPLLQNGKFSCEAKKLEDLRKEALTKGFAINSTDARLSLSHVFADTLDHYKTADFIQFFAESARYFAEQNKRLRTGTNLTAQFIAADNRKAVRRPNERTSEPDTAERLALKKENRLAVRRPNERTSEPDTVEKLALMKENVLNARSSSGPSGKRQDSAAKKIDKSHVGRPPSGGSNSAVRDAVQKERRHSQRGGNSVRRPNERTSEPDTAERLALMKENVLNTRSMSGPSRNRQDSAAKKIDKSHVGPPPSGGSNSAVRYAEQKDRRHSQRGGTPVRRPNELSENRKDTAELDDTKTDNSIVGPPTSRRSKSAGQFLVQYDRILSLKGGAFDLS